MSRIGMTLRIGASCDELTVVNGDERITYDRSGMKGLQKKALAKDVQAVRRHNMGQLA
jgi:hypothetical protein